MQIKFYKSALEGDAVIKVFEANSSNVSPDGLVELKPNSTDAATDDIS